MPPVSCSITAVTRTTTAKCPPKCPKCPKCPLPSVECCLKGSYHQTDLSATDSFGYVLPWWGHSSPARGPAQRGAAFFSSDVLNAAGLVQGGEQQGGGQGFYCCSALGLAGQGPAEEAHGAAKDLAKDLAM